jgi:hypothetical protein
MLQQLGQNGPAPAVTGGELAATMIVRGSVGSLIGAAVAPVGREGAWGVIGFVVGTTFGEVGIVGIALAALYNKANRPR